MQIVQTVELCEEELGESQMLSGKSLTDFRR